MRIHAKSIFISLGIILMLCFDGFGEVKFKYTPPAHPILHVLSFGTKCLIVTINGEVKILKSGSVEYIPAVKNEYLDFGDVLQLEPYASIELVSEGNESIVIGPVTAIKWVTLKSVQY